LQPAFYTVENLKPFFGMMDVNVRNYIENDAQIRFSANSWNYGRVLGVVINSPAQKLHFMDLLDSSVGGGLYLKSGKRGGFRISFNDKTIPLEGITSIFGNDYVIDKWWPMPSMHYVPPPVTSPLGLKKIDFKLDYSNYEKSIQIYTHPNGAVDSFFVVVKVK
jgi:hypothetical protein